MARQWFANGVQIYEDGVEEYFVSGFQLNEDQAAPVAGGLPFYPLTRRRRVEEMQYHIHIKKSLLVNSQQVTVNPVLSRPRRLSLPNQRHTASRRCVILPGSGAGGPVIINRPRRVVRYGSTVIPAKRKIYSTGSATVTKPIISRPRRTM